MCSQRGLTECRQTLVLLQVGLSGHSHERNLASFPMNFHTDFSIHFRKKHSWWLFLWFFGPIESKMKISRHTPHSSLLWALEGPQIWLGLGFHPFCMIYVDLTDGDLTNERGGWEDRQAKEFGLVFPLFWLQAFGGALCWRPLLQLQPLANFCIPKVLKTISAFDPFICILYDYLLDKVLLFSANSWI